MFQILSVCLSAIAFFLAWLIYKRSSEGSRWAREKIGGILLGTVCLAWAAYEGNLMLEGSLAKFHALVWILVPVTVVSSWLCLDFLLARALGGFMVLAANALIRYGFAESVPLRGVFSVDCLVLGVIGLFLIGVPWRMRDGLDWFSRHGKFRLPAAVLFALWGVILLLSLGAK